jgi:hypothetical protein
LTERLAKEAKDGGAVKEQLLLIQICVLFYGEKIDNKLRLPYINGWSKE